MLATGTLVLFDSHLNPLRYHWDRPRIHDLGPVVDVWARWDSDWYVQIAQHGYVVAVEPPRLLPALPAPRRPSRSSPRRAHRPGRRPRLARRVCRRVRPARPAHTAEARRRSGGPRRPLSRRLPHDALPRGRLQRVVVPAPLAGRVPARGAWALPGCGRRRGSRRADAAGRARADPRTRRARLAVVRPAARARGHRRDPGAVLALSARALALARSSARVPRRAEGHLASPLLRAGGRWAASSRASSSER